MPPQGVKVYISYHLLMQIEDCFEVVLTKFVAIEQDGKPGYFSGNLNRSFDFIAGGTGGFSEGHLSGDAVFAFGGGGG